MRQTTQGFLGYIKSTDKFQLKILFIHLIFENVMNAIFTYYFKNGAKLDDETYSTKVNILQATELADDETIHNLRIVNKMRNTIAHNLIIPNSIIKRLINEIKIEDKMRVYVKQTDINKELEDIFVYVYDKLDVIAEKVVKGKLFKEK